MSSDPKWAGTVAMRLVWMVGTGLMVVLAGCASGSTGGDPDAALGRDAAVDAGDPCTGVTACCICLPERCE